MKPLDQYPTPETDALAEKIGDMPYGINNPRYRKCRDLERRLAACREYVVRIQEENAMFHSNSDSIAIFCEQALTLTAPKP